MASYPVNLDRIGGACFVPGSGSAAVCFVCGPGGFGHGVRYLDAIDCFESRDTEGGFLYRGHEVGKWQLRSNIDRYWAVGRPSNSSELVEAARRTIIEEFREQCVRHGFVKDTELDPATTEGALEIEMLAQHYGLPTRLLDWSDNYNVAMFFAYGGWSKMSLDAPCVWRLDLAKFRSGAVELRKRADYLNEPTPAEIYKDYTEMPDAVRIVGRATSMNERVRRQRGFFTYSEDRTKTVETYISEQECFPPDTLSKVLLRNEDQQFALRHLARAGTSAAAVRADMDGVSVDMVNLFIRFAFGQD